MLKLILSKVIFIKTNSSITKTNDFIQTNWITLSHYGVPKSDKFHTTEESRRYLQIPLHDDSFKNFIPSLDNHFASDNFKKQFLDEKQ